MILVDEATFADYWAKISAEQARIGFTAEDYRYLGSGGGPITLESLQAALADLRATPSGIGARGYYARHGVDFEALVRETQRHEADPGTSSQ